MEKTIRAEPFQADKMGHLFLMEREFQGSLSRGESAVEGSEGGTKGGWRLGRPGEEAGREKPPYWNREGLPSGQQRAKWQPMMTQAPPSTSWKPWANLSQPQFPLLYAAVKRETPRI